MLKKEIRERVISGLVEQGVIILTEQLESAPFSSSLVEESGPDTKTPSGSGEGQAGEQRKTPFTLPRYDPSPQSAGNTEARLKVRLARLQLEAHERETQSQLQLQLEIRKAELQAETEKAVRLRQLELEAVDTGRNVIRGSGMSLPSTTTTSSPNLH